MPNPHKAEEAGEELFVVTVNARQLAALRWEAIGASTLAQLNEDLESFWAEIGHCLDAAKPESSIQGLKRALEEIGKARPTTGVPLKDTLAGCRQLADAALASFKQEVE